MSSFSIKQGVDCSRVHAACVRAWPTIAAVLSTYGLEATITSVRDGDHMQGSMHYAEPNRAQDWRTWEPRAPGIQIPWETKVQICEDLMKVLGPEWDVVPEDTHIHTEFDGAA